MWKLLSPKHINLLLFCLTASQISAQAGKNETLSRNGFQEQSLVLENQESQQIKVKVKNEFGEGIRLEIFSSGLQNAIAVLYLHGYENDRDLSLEPALYEFKVFSLENEYLGSFKKNIDPKNPKSFIAVSRFILE
jgi:hypothetical protein